MSLQSHLAELKKKHAAFDEQLKELQRSPSACSCAIAELKKQKLQLKDRIASLSGQLQRHEAAAAQAQLNAANAGGRRISDKMRKTLEAALAGGSVPGAADVINFNNRRPGETQHIADVAARVARKVAAHG